MKNIRNARGIPCEKMRNGMKFRRVCTILCCLLFSMALWAQMPTIKVTHFSVQNTTLKNAIKQLEKTVDTGFFYESKEMEKVKGVSLTMRNTTLEEVLKHLLAGTGFTFEYLNGNVVITKAKQISAPPRKEDAKKTISGKVVDENGELVIGAVILLGKTQTGTITDVNGDFFLETTQSNPKLTIAYLGLKTTEIVASTSKKNSVVLKEDAKMINEVVVTGYQDIKKEKMTGSVTTIRTDKINERYTPNIMTNLEGRVAGLTTYGGKTTIRGTSSLFAETTPLLVVDGVPIEGSIEDLNPYDIESVNVLKDAASSAIYGARASNGVIVVTTKNAKKKGKIDIDFSANLSIYEKKNLDYADNFYMTPEQQVDVESEFYDYMFNSGQFTMDPIQYSWMMIDYMNYQDVSPIWYGYYQKALGQITQEQLDEKLNQLKKNNFAKEFGEEILRQQVMQQYNLSLRSRSDKMQNSLTLNYKYDNSGMINSNNSALNISYKGSYDIASWLTASVDINGVYTNSKSPGMDQTSWHTNVFGHAAYDSMYEADGTPHLFYYMMNGNNYWSSKNTAGLHDLGVNIKDEFYNNVQTTKRQHMRYHGNLLFKIIKGLTANAQFVYETSHTTTEWLANEESHVARTIRNAYTTLDYSTGKVTYMTPENGGMLRTTNTDGNYWTARGQVNYDRIFGKHAITALAGLEFRETKTTGTKSLMLGYDEQLQSSASLTVNFKDLSQIYRSPYYMMMSGMFNPAIYVFTPYFSNAIGVIPEVRHRYASGYANLTYTFDEKYNVFGSYRKDYADVYGLNSKFRGKPLWSVGAGWNAHNESFIKDNFTWINFLKLRVSYGVTGNIYQGATSYMTASSSGMNDLTNLPQGVIESPANPDLRWEQSRTTNIGLDFSVLNNRLRGSIDYYKKASKDVFANKSLDPTTGFGSLRVNNASLENKGIEMQLSYDWFNDSRREDFTWSTSFTLSHNKNKVTHVENPATSASQMLYDENCAYKAGYPSSALWSYRFAGISDKQGEQGRTLWYAEDGSTALNVANLSVDVLEYSGQKDPKIVMGMDNTWKWNGLSLSVLMAYYGGHKMRALAKNEVDYVPYSTALPSYFLNAWTPENPTNTPGIGQYASGQRYGMTAYSNTAIHDADFLKIRNIVLGYELPERWLQGIGVNRVSLRFQIDNPKYLWVKNKVGVDPETLGIRGQSAYIFGLNINL